VATFDEAIPPGQEGKITLKMNTSNESGTMSKSANVFSNDPQRPMTKIELKAAVKEYIQVSPGYHVVLNGYSGDKVKATIAISAASDEPLELANVTSSIDESIQYKLTTVKKGKEYSLEINTGTGLTKSFHGKVTVGTTHPKKPKIELVVIGSVKSDIKIAPRYLYFGVIDTTAETTDPTSLVRTATLESMRARATSIERIESSDWIKTSVKSDAKNLKHTVTITLDKSKLSRKGDFREEITVYLQCNKKQETATILVAGKVR